MSYRKPPLNRMILPLKGFAHQLTSCNVCINFLFLSHCCFIPNYQRCLLKKLGCPTLPLCFVKQKKVGVSMHMLVVVKILNCMLCLFSAYMIMHTEHIVWESDKRLFCMTKILSQENRRTKYVILCIIVSFLLTIRGEKRK